MSNLLLVNGATLSLRATPPAVIVTATHSLSVPATPRLATAGGKELFTRADIEASLASYMTPYSNASFLGGTLKFSALKSIAQLSTLTTHGGPAAATAATTGVITCSPAPAATDPNSGTSDPTPTYDLEFSVLDAGQTLAKTE